MRNRIEIPTKGLCPLACFDKAKIEEKDGKKLAPPEDLDKGMCWVPALYLSEGTYPTETCFIDCAAIDNRSDYRHCQIFLRWFWYQVAKRRRPIKRE